MIKYSTIIVSTPEQAKQSQDSLFSIIQANHKISALAIELACDAHQIYSKAFTLRTSLDSITKLADTLSSKLHEQRPLDFEAKFLYETIKRTLGEAWQEPRRLSQGSLTDPASPNSIHPNDRAQLMQEFLALQRSVANLGLLNTAHFSKSLQSAAFVPSDVHDQLKLAQIRLQLSPIASPPLSYLKEASFISPEKLVQPSPELLAESEDLEWSRVDALLEQRDLMALQIQTLDFHLSQAEDIKSKYHDWISATQREKRRLELVVEKLRSLREETRVELTRRFSQSSSSFQYMKTLVNPVEEDEEVFVLAREEFEEEEDDQEFVLTPEPRQEELTPTSSQETTKHTPQDGLITPVCLSPSSLSEPELLTSPKGPVKQDLSHHRLSTPLMSPPSDFLDMKTPPSKRKKKLLARKKSRTFQINTKQPS